MGTIKILIVEDELLIAKNLTRKLKKFGYEIPKIVTTGEDAVQWSISLEIDLILMDIALKGDLDGIEAATQIQQIKNIPIIYLTAYADEKTLQRAEETGSYGYLLKPCQEKTLHATIKIALKKHQELAKAQESLTTITANKDGKYSHYWVHYNSLTNLPNRLSLRDHFNQVLLKEINPPKSSSPSSTIDGFDLYSLTDTNRIIPIIFLDLDRFNRINNTLDPKYGDFLLRAVAQRLKTFIDKKGKIAHLDADKFAIILFPIQKRKELIKIVKNLLLEISQPFFIKRQELVITASVGITLHHDDETDIYQLLQQANKAMLKAKQQGGNRYQFYTEELKFDDSNLADKLALETDLRHALERNELEIYYQPKINLKTNKIIGAEALLRWHHPSRGQVSPGIFIPIAEEIGLIEKIGAWVLKIVCRQIKTWQIQGIKLERVGVNLSARQFNQSNLVPKLTQILVENDLEGKDLEIELTESIVVTEPKRAIEQLKRLKALDIQIAIDDFGTGYSSLSYLQQFPFDILKIDRCFIQNIDKNSKSAAITQTLIKLAHQLNLRVVAEGVETQAELAFLQQNHCDEVQGYLFSRPVASSDFEKQLSRKNQQSTVNNQ